MSNLEIVEEGKGFVIPSAQLRSRIVLAVLSFCAIGISLICIYGDPINSLHQSALSWAFTISGGTIAVAILDQALNYFILMRGVK